MFVESFGICVEVASFAESPIAEGIGVFGFGFPEVDDPAAQHAWMFDVKMDMTCLECGANSCELAVEVLADFAAEHVHKNIVGVDGVGNA